jgi:hypothetical protein
MAFVPEGQAESSQARSAWVTIQRGPVPEGRLKSHPNNRLTTFRSQAEIGSNVPLGLGYFSHHTRHFVPDYDRAVPPGRKPFYHQSASH